MILILMMKWEIYFFLIIWKIFIVYKLYYVDVTNKSILFVKICFRLNELLDGGLYILEVIEIVGEIFLGKI